MRVNQVIREQIRNRPYRLKAYVEGRISALRKIEESLTKVTQIIAANQEGSNLLYYSMRYAGHADAALDLDWFAGVAERFEQHIPVEGLRQTLESYAKYGNTFMRYIFSMFEYRKGIDDRLRAVMAALPDVPKGFEEQGYRPGSDYLQDDEYVAAHSLWQALTVLAKIIQDAEAIANDIKTKLGEVYKMVAMGHHWERYRPEHGEIETLYHATAFCTEILRDGFAAEPPEGRRGLGNYGDVKLISFTHSLDIAHTISRCLKEMWLISHGMLTAREIWKWIVAEKLNETNDVVRMVGLSVEVPNENPKFPPGYRHKTIAELKTPAEVAKLYSVYLALTETRSNPVFTYVDQVVDTMKDRELADIGVLACEVRLDGKEQYLIGESEFRLPADRVYSVRRMF